MLLFASVICFPRKNIELFQIIILYFTKLVKSSYLHRCFSYTLQSFLQPFPFCLQQQKIFFAIVTEPAVDIMTALIIFDSVSVRHCDWYWDSTLWPVTHYMYNVASHVGIVRRRQPSPCWIGVEKKNFLSKCLWIWHWILTNRPRSCCPSRCRHEVQIDRGVMCDGQNGPMTLNSLTLVGTSRQAEDETAKQWTLIIFVTGWFKKWLCKSNFFWFTCCEESL